MCMCNLINISTCIEINCMRAEFAPGRLLCSWSTEILLPLCAWWVFSSPEHSLPQLCITLCAFLQAKKGGTGGGFALLLSAWNIFRICGCFGGGKWVHWQKITDFKFVGFLNRLLFYLGFYSLINNPLHLA